MSAAGTATNEEFMSRPGAASWTDPNLWHVALNANWPDITTPDDMRWLSLMYRAGQIPFPNPMFKPATTAPYPIVQQIRLGRYDTQIEDWLMEISRITADGTKLVVTPYPEMNGRWVNYGPEPSPDFGAAVDIFRSIVIRGRGMGLGPDRVLWCWAPNDVGVGNLVDYWPGDKYVDIVGGSCFNWGGFGYSWASWQTPAEIIDPYVDQIRRFTDKPIVITQTGSGEGDSRTPGWLDQLVEYTKGGRIDGFIWFSISEFTYQPGPADFNRRVASLDSTRPDDWFKETEVTPPIQSWVTPFDYDQYQWLSRTKYPDRTKLPWQVDKTVIHWGGTTNPGDSDNTLEEQIAYEMSILRGWQRYHIDTRGWTDIAYSYAVGNSGMRYRLRGENRAGATRGDYEGDGIPENEEARALVWIGGQGHTPSDAAYAAMGSMVDPSMPVILHFEVRQTACPGPDWAAWRDRQGWEDDGVPVPPPTGEYKMRTLRNGAGSRNSRDASVAAAQRAMTLKGHRDDNTADNKCGADGIFRSGTERQVKNFQQANGLVIDGTVGDATWMAIDKE